MAKITRNTPFRKAGMTTSAQWSKGILAAGGPADLASERCWRASGKYGAILYFLLQQESSFGTDYDWNSIENLNPFNIRRKDKKYEQEPRGYLKFNSYEEAVAAAASRINGDSGWFDGPNPYADDVSISDLIYTYAPPGPPEKPWNPTETLIANMVSRLNSITLISELPTDEVTPNEPPVEQLEFGNGTLPDVRILESWKPDHQGSAYGYIRVPKRHNVAVVNHETQGDPPGDQGVWYEQFFECYDGERCTDALVDAVCARNGQITQINDPEGTKAPWANGGGVLSAGGLEGDGVAFYNRFGIEGIDRKALSLESVKTDTGRLTKAQIENEGRYFAYYMDRDQQPYTLYPYVQKYGCVTYLNHFELGTTNCAQYPEDNDAVLAVMKMWLKAWQTNSNPGQPVPPTVPPLPELPLPGGISVKEATTRFKKYRKFNAAGTRIADGGFDPKGPISLGWARRCAELFGSDFAKWPAIGDWRQITETVDKNTVEVIDWDGVDWLLIRKGTGNAPWSWV